MKRFEKITLLQTPGQLTMLHNSFQYIQKLDETLRHNASGNASKDYSIMT